jgi:hypothetical protein
VTVNLIAEPIHDPVDTEANIRRHAAGRARELGGAPRADDVAIVWAGLETPPGARLFRAHWADRGGDRALTGVWTDSDVNSRPLDAIDLLLRRWRETTGRLPDAGIVASACAFLLDADCRHRLLVRPIEEPLEAAPARLRWRLHEPVYLGGERDLPLAFCWLDTSGRYFRVQIGRDRNGRIAFEAIALQDLERSQGGEPGNRDE